MNANAEQGVVRKSVRVRASVERAFSVVVEQGTPGPYFASFTELAQLPDL